MYGTASRKHLHLLLFLLSVHRSCLSLLLMFVLPGCAIHHLSRYMRSPNLPGPVAASWVLDLDLSLSPPTFFRLVRPLCSPGKGESEMTRSGARLMIKNANDVIRLHYLVQRQYGRQPRAEPSLREKNDLPPPNSPFPFPLRILHISTRIKWISI